MPIKFFPRQERVDEEEVKKRAAKAQDKYQTENKVIVPKEKGAEEGDLEDIIPGGSALSMMTPIGTGKAVVKKGIKELAEMGAPKILKEGAREAKNNALAIFNKLKSANDQLAPNAQKTMKELRDQARREAAHAKSVQYKDMAEPEVKY